MIRAVFLDREGILTPPLAEGEFVLQDDQAVLMEGVGEALARLRDAGMELFIASNQSCVRRGLISQVEMERLHGLVLARLAEAGIVIRDSRLCPHVDADGCACRKPKPGMILEMCMAHGIDPGVTAMIGDAPRDVEAGIAAGCARSYLVSPLDLALPLGALRCSSLDEAVVHLLA